MNSLDQVRFAAKGTGEMFAVTKRWWVENWWIEFESNMTRAGLYTFEVRSRIGV